MNGSQEIDDGFFGLVLQIQLLLVEEDPLSVFSVVCWAIREDRDVSVLHRLNGWRCG